MALHKDLVGADIHETNIKGVATNPTGIVTPSAIGQTVCAIDTNMLWRATGLLNTNWVLTGDGSGGSAGGATTQVQYNSAGSFAASANLAWDNTNEALLLGGLTTVLPFVAPRLEAISDAGGPGAALVAVGYGSGNHPILVGISSDGTNTSPVALASGRKMAIFGGTGYDGAGYGTNSTGGEMNFESNEAWSPAAHGAVWTLNLTPNGSIVHTDNVLYATATPSSALGVGRVPGTAVDGPYGLEVSGAITSVTDSMGNGGFVRCTAYNGGSGIFVSYSANGTELSPMPTLAGDLMRFDGAKGFDGLNFSPGSRGAILCIAQENFTPTAQGTQIRFRVTALGSVANTNIMLLGPSDVRITSNARVTNGANVDRFLAIENNTATSANTWLLVTENTTGRFHISENDGAGIFRPFTLEKTAPDNSLYVAASGNVGIGTATPSSTLSVFGSLSVALSSIDDTDSPYAVTDEAVIIADATSGAITVNLPTAVGIGGRMYTIKKIDASANVVTVDANGAETIDGALTLPISLQYSAFQVISDGANWFVI